MKHTVALSGSFQGSSEALFRNLPKEGVIHSSLIGREVVFRVRSDRLDEIKSHLSSIGVENISILEWRESGMTLSGSGLGSDDAGVVEVSLIPTASGEGFRQLAVLSELSFERSFLLKVKGRVEDVLEDAGLTDVLYTVRIKSDSQLEEILDAASIATLNAVFDASGVIAID
ncbi:MAG: hypothetical protein B6U72_00770 [Candidatus Altiarchaeales archaeon ex4484_2]|nr:MAG: hypothetical protein B6U72_00770 [Candidatus Altiarchaeales archaeon ex4484_2]